MLIETSLVSLFKEFIQKEMSSMLEQDKQVSSSVNDIILEKITLLTENFNLKNDTLIEKFETIENKMNELSDKVQLLEKKMIHPNNPYANLDENSVQEDIMEIKKDNIEVEQSIVLRALTFRDYRTVIILFKALYFKEDNIIDKYPIRLTGKRSYEYYLNNKWITDPYGHYIRDIILSNIQTTLFKYNTYEYIKDNDILIMNQDFIYKIMDEKYSKIYFRNMIQEIRNTV